MTELEKLQRRYEAIRAEGGDLAFTLGDDPGSMEEIAAVANAMLDYAAQPLGSASERDAAAAYWRRPENRAEAIRLGFVSADQETAGGTP